MKLTKELIYGFVGSVLSESFDEPVVTPDCHLEWWDLCCSSHRYVAIAAPRGHAKSTAVTKCFGLASVLFRQSKFLLLLSDTYQQACMFLGELKRELSSNEKLIRLFGVKGFLVDRENDIIVEFDDGYKFRIIAFGAEQKLRGLLWDGRRPDLAIGDDLENDEIVMNPDRREKFRNWVLNVVIPALSPQGRARFVGTILHMDSFLERQMPQESDPKTIRKDLSFWMAKPDKGWFGVKYFAHGPDGGFQHILWPERCSREYLEERRAMYEKQGNPEGYWQEYLNRPIDPHNAFFMREDLRDFDDGDRKRDWTYAPTYLSVDLAVSVQTRRDYCVLGIGSVDNNGMLYIRRVIRERLDPKELLEWIVRLQAIYKFSTMLVGKGSFEKAIGPFLREAFRAKDGFLHIEAIPEVVDKRMRATSIRGRMRAGGVKFDKSGAWYPAFEAEILRFDRDIYDDQVDMMSLYGLFLDRIQFEPTRKEIEAEEWEDEFGPSLADSMSLGRSAITGY